ncbi:MAG: hypothetical protein ACI4KR_07295 [Ruminiclostridium sp.]
MAKLVPCTCGGNGHIVDVAPPQEELELCEQNDTRPFRLYAIKCDKCGKLTDGYIVKSPARREWNRMNTLRVLPKNEIFSKKQKTLIKKKIARFLKGVRDEWPDDNHIPAYAEDLLYEIIIAADKGAKHEQANKK